MVKNTEIKFVGQPIFKQLVILIHTTDFDDKMSVAEGMQDTLILMNRRIRDPNIRWWERRYCESMGSPDVYSTVCSVFNSLILFPIYFLLLSILFCANDFRIHSQI